MLYSSVSWDKESNTGLRIVFTLVFDCGIYPLRSSQRAAMTGLRLELAKQGAKQVSRSDNGAIMLEGLGSARV